MAMYMFYADFDKLFWLILLDNGAHCQIPFNYICAESWRDSLNKWNLDVKHTHLIFFCFVMYILEIRVVGGQIRKWSSRRTKKDVWSLIAWISRASRSPRLSQGGSSKVVYSMLWRIVAHVQFTHYVLYACIHVLQYIYVHTALLCIHITCGKLYNYQCCSRDRFRDLTLMLK